MLDEARLAAAGWPLEHDWQTLLVAHAEDLDLIACRDVIRRLAGGLPNTLVYRGHVTTRREHSGHRTSLWSRRHAGDEPQSTGVSVDPKRHSHRADAARTLDN